MKLKELKEGYAKLSKKYNLPDFKKLNEAFEIDRIERDTDNVLREIRKTMMDKIIGYIRFVEMLINPAQAPPIFMIFVKEISVRDRGVFENVYKNLIELELSSLKLEIDYSEVGEAETIKNIFQTWDNLKPDLRSVLDIMKKNLNSSPSKKEKGYFG
ncbi:MAG: hypothetical protein IIA87_05695 [Nanoarchaeota archaeon]|nr:hypothetical protein [Nanoarchaeota archaeon]